MKESGRMSTMKQEVTTNKDEQQTEKSTNKAKRQYLDRICNRIMKFQT